MKKNVLVYGMTNNPGGIESYLLYALEKAKKQGIQFDFVTDFPQIVYESKLKDFGSNIFFIPAKGKKLIKHWKEFWKILKEHPQYDTVYFNILDAGAVLTMVVPWLLGRKIIVHSHNGDTDKKMLHYTCRPLLNMITDEFVACSNLAAEFMFGKSKQNSERIILVPNAIDAKKYEFSSTIRKEYRELLKVDDQFVVCHIGRITRQKNPYRLIDIFKQVYLDNNRARLLYVGTGELETEIKEYVKANRLSEVVYFLGKRNDIPQLMQAADVLLLPSLYEGLPIVAVEAQASGLPVVLSTNIAAETDITGLLTFVDLKDNDIKWAKYIIEKEHFVRESYLERIRKAGYDKQSESTGLGKLFEIM